MNLFTFVQWCFRDGDSGLSTIIVGWLLIAGLTGLVSAARRRK